MVKKIKIFLVIAIMLSLVFSGCLFNGEKKEEYMTVKQLHDMDKWRKWAYFSEGEVFNIKDKVVDVKVIKIIRVEWQDETLNYTVYPNITEIYTRVYFESDENWPLEFIGNRSNDFPIGEVVNFSLIAERYEINSVTIRNATIIEPLYVWTKILEYQSAMSSGVFAPLNFTKQYSDNNTKITITITNTTDFFPLPTNWSKVRATQLYKYRDNLTDILTSPKISIYNSNGYLIGTIDGEKSNIQKDEEIKTGDYLTFNYLSDYNSTHFVFYYYDIYMPRFWRVEL